MITIAKVVSSATILLVVWSANDDGNALTSEASSKVNSLKDNTSDGILQPYSVILQTNRERCTLKKEILNLLNKESVCGVHSGGASL